MRGYSAMPPVLMRCALALLALALPGAVQAQSVPNVAAASDLRFALAEVTKAFRRDTGHRVRLTFGSSGNFYRQLQQGAPFQLFLSADEGYALKLAKAGKTIDGGRLYAIGRLAVVAPRGSRLKADSNLNGLRTALSKGQVAHFAIANPEHAPYGDRAAQALKHAGLWGPLSGKLVLGENVSQALQFATSGGSQGGIVAYSLVLDPTVKARTQFALLPASWHAPLRQRMVLMKNASPVAKAFYRYIQQDPARRILARYGFALPKSAGT
ncbi:molybdate ABC transporter substrate-binding protein [Novosphingobium sp. M1R2S20]|uniref:Molybdate ABC transporter substrate-binding protein n=1 Tax=Novosphingobium rhizovicinum TaxID=3228928 RepID=A0ABV3RDR4_9SPHN